MHYRGPRRGRGGAENLFEEITAEISLIWGKKQISRSRKTRELHITWTQGSTPKHIKTKISQVKDKWRIIKAARKKNLLCAREPNKIISWFFSRNCRPEGSVMIYSEWWKEKQKTKNKKLPTKNPLPARVSFRIKGEREFSRQAKAKGVHHH